MRGRERRKWEGRESRGGKGEKGERKG